MVNPTDPHTQITARSVRPPSEIEISGLELLRLDDDSDDVSCDSYCADSIPMQRLVRGGLGAPALPRAILQYTTTTRPCLKPALSRTLSTPAIMTRRLSLTSQLTEDESMDSLDLNDSLRSICFPCPNIATQIPPLDLTDDNNFPDFAQDSMILAFSVSPATRGKIPIRSFSQSVVTDMPPTRSYNSVGRAA